MTLIPISSINTENRQRKYFDEMKIVDLADSIESEDLIHPPAVMQSENGYILVAGERRLRAMMLLHKKSRPFSHAGEIVPLDLVPVTFVSERDSLALKEAELAENLLREDLTWQERVAAEQELHKLRLKQTDGKQKIVDTFKEVSPDVDPSGSSLSNFKDDLFLANHLDDPEIAKERDKKKALAKAKAKVMQANREALREKFEIEIKESKSPHVLHLGDFRLVADSLSPGSYDLVLTDPPYGVDAGAFNDQFTHAHKYSDNPENWGLLMDDLAALSFKLTKPRAHAFVFCDIRRWPELQAKFAREGWDVWNRPLIWDKGSIGALPKPNHGPRLCYEAILFASKGNKPVTRTGRDVLPFPNTHKNRHAAEKPVDLYAELIDRCSAPGDLVLDPFCGSGTIFPAATRMAVKATGIEVDEDYHLVAMERINE